MSLNLNCEGKLENDGPHPPSGLSLIVGSEKDDILVCCWSWRAQGCCTLLKIHALPNPDACINYAAPTE